MKTKKLGLEQTSLDLSISRTPWTPRSFPLWSALLALGYVAIARGWGPVLVGRTLPLTWSCKETRN